MNQDVQLKEWIKGDSERSQAIECATSHELELVASFGLNPLFNNMVTMNCKRKIVIKDTH
ncbi:hypothetical protein [Marinomonas sp. 2405UD68-3]|uniref:hypothetical protein n=1 Tax=Marinomonas sp. 2405UD68-3 TaxID=3391835 RepID=UPI0039C96E58